MPFCLTLMMMTLMTWVLRWFRWVYLLIPYTEDPSSLIPTKTSARG